MKSFGRLAEMGTAVRGSDQRGERLRLGRRAAIWVIVAIGCLLGAPSSMSGASKRIAFELPWSLGQSWRYIGGPHSTLGCPDNGFSCTGRKPWNSLDFGGGNGIVRAAASGTIERTTNCPARNSNFVIVNHGDGWHSTYYHLTDIPPRLTEDTPVHVGDKLGRASTKTGCGGHADGPHVHFSIAHYTGKYSWHSGRVDLDGFQIGSWLFHDGRTQYSGCATNVVNDQRVCPGGLIKNGTLFHVCHPISPMASLRATGLGCVKARDVVSHWGQRADCKPDGTLCEVEGFRCIVQGASHDGLRCQAGPQLIAGRLGNY